MHAAIVTGVSRGLGEALAGAMLARGFAVLGVGRMASPRLKGRLYYTPNAIWRSRRCSRLRSLRRCAALPPGSRRR